MKLKARHISQCDIDAVLNQLIDAGWLSDDRYAAQLLRARVNRGYGPLRIGAELRSQGLASPVIKATLDSSEIDWSQCARDARIKRFGAGLPNTPSARAQQIRFLNQRGFSSEHRRFALKSGEE